jgi:hypothetical protein
MSLRRIGAQTSILKEKWDLIIDAFTGCPVAEVTNPYAGVYVWLVGAQWSIVKSCLTHLHFYVQWYKDPYLGLQDGFVSSFFRDVLGVRTTTYNFGFRDINETQIETFYGPGYSAEDFTRLSLYSDVSAYVEVARRAKLVCGDTTASIGDYISVDQWVEASNATAARRRLQGKDFESVEKIASATCSSTCPAWRSKRRTGWLRTTTMMQLWTAVLPSVLPTLA